nr:ankyrin repeat domain-containing protein [Paenibacillus bovis]
MQLVAQPEILKTNDYVALCGGKGNDVWDMLTACMNGEVSTVQKLLKKEPSLIHCNWAYLTPLHFAVREGHLEIVGILLNAVADGAYISGLSWHESPLQLAKDRRYTEIEKLLEKNLHQTFQSNSLGESIATLVKQRKQNEVIQLMNDNPEAINVSDERGNTPLHWAVLTRQLELMDYLIDKGIDVEAKRADGCKVIHIALEGDYFYRTSRDLDRKTIRNTSFILGYLIAKGCQYDIFVASAIGDTEYIDKIISKDSVKINELDSSRRSALYYAAKHGNEEAVRLLLEHGANPNQAERDAVDGAALHAAVSGNYLSIVKLLLEYGANVHAEVEASGNPLYIAMRDNNHEIVELLYMYGANISLTASCALGRIDLVGELVALKPSSVNAGDYGPLTQAISSGHTRIVHLLLKHKVELNAPWYASNYMVYAFRFSDIEMVRLLLDHGANPNNINWVGISYLHIVAQQGNVGLAKLLIDYGADINVIDDENCTTPLGWAAKYGHLEMVTFLLKQGAKKIIKGMPEWAEPIAWAKRKGHNHLGEILR